MSDLKIFAKTIDAAAERQINSLLAVEAFKDCKVRIMPDVHAGAGCVIGFTAKLGEVVLIPLNMRDGCIIGVGLGNPDWNESAPHGAGRIMSRAQARASVTLDDFQSEMRGIYTTSATAETIDEAPQAYKPAQEIIDMLEETVKIVRIIKPVYNFKAGD